jgi:DNA-binding SARP family transcriptional activator
MYDHYANLARLYLPLLASPQPPVRQQACIILLGTYGNRALTYVRRLIDDVDPQVRQDARLALLAVAEVTDLGIHLQPYSGMYAECLGRLRVYVGNQEIRLQDWARADSGRVGWQKVQGTLAYLIHCGRRGASRAAIGAAAWGGPFSANSLSRTLATLRQALSNTCGQSFAERALLIGDEHCILDPDCYHTDADLFERTFNLAMRLEQEQGVEAAIPVYNQIVHLYTGPYMADVPRGSGWSELRRDRLTSAFVSASERLAEHFYGRGQYRQCLHMCAAALDADEVADDIIVWQLRAYAQEGLYANLEQVYRRYARAMAIEPQGIEAEQDMVVQTYRQLSSARR